MDRENKIPEIPMQCQGYCSGEPCYRYSEVLQAMTVFCPMNALAGVYFINDPSPKWSLVYPVNKQEWMQFLEDRTLEHVSSRPELIN